MNKDRIKKLQSMIEAPLLVKKKENLYYLTGRFFMHGYLLVTKKDVIFFGDGLEKSGFTKSDRLKYIGKYLRRGSKFQIENVFTFAESDYLKAKLKGTGIRFTVVPSPVDQTRAIKSQEEIRLVGRSMQIVDRVFIKVKKALKTKFWTERSLADFIAQQGLRAGASGGSFDPIVASGANAAIPHHVPSSKKLISGESIIIDFGFKYHEYCSDFTRTVFLKTVPKKLALAYEQTELAYLHSLWAAKPGAKASSLYNIATETLAKKSLDKYFIHNLGHGTGLEIHELPNLSPVSQEKLSPGMVFSVEPGVYIPKVGGIRIEDLVYLDSKKLNKFIFVSTSLADNIF